MKKVALVGIGFLCVLVFAVIGFAGDVRSSETSAFVQVAKVTAAQAKDIALKRVPGKIIEEYSIDDEKGVPEFFVFVIKANDGKKMEVMIGAVKGDIVSVENYEDEDEDPSGNR